MRKKFILYSIGSLLAIAVGSYFWLPVLWALILVIPLILCGTFDMWQKSHTILRNFPVIGHGRWVMELLRPPIYQYFIESNTGGAPINRVFRTVVYQRAKGVLDTVPFGTELDVYRVGYEWMDHSLSALGYQELNHNIRVTIGGNDCKKPYDASLLNISAMSFGALSQNAILALNGGAKIGGFYHNTGEGSVSPHHLKPGGDLCWQIGTGYFGCRNKEGFFSEDLFKETATLENIKMIEIKLSQGAKPGHGGILPSSKNTSEIAKIRGVKPYTRVISPPTHTSFSTPIEMMHFIRKLRVLSGGKPIGFKFCLGRRSEFVAICRAMLETGIHPDFITVDGGEGGTGAAPLEYTNSVGSPLRDSLPFVIDCLIGFDLKNKVKVIASGKIFTGFHMVKNLAIGADLCNSARAMMLSLGCIQALKCNSNDCPTGVATQNPDFTKGLVVPEKEKRVANFQKETITSLVELLAAAGLQHPAQLNRSHVHRRVSATEVLRYDEIFPYLAPGSLLEPPYPKRFRQEMEEATSESFTPKACTAFVGEDLKEIYCPIILPS